MTNYKMKTPKKVENAVVGTYKKIENGVVAGYKKVEGKFIDSFLEETDKPTYDVENKKDE